MLENECFGGWFVAKMLHIVNGTHYVTMGHISRAIYHFALSFHAVKTHKLRVNCLNE